MAHAQKPDFVFRRNGQVHLNRRGRQFSRLLPAEVCASTVVMLDTPCSEVVWRVLATPLHSPVSPSLPLPCVTVCHRVSTGLYNVWLQSLTHKHTAKKKKECLLSAGAVSFTCHSISGPRITKINHGTFKKLVTGECYMPSLEKPNKNFPAHWSHF